jgi:hypothetical protein
LAIWPFTWDLSPDEAEIIRFNYNFRQEIMDKAYKLAGLYPENGDSEAVATKLRFDSDRSEWELTRIPWDSFYKTEETMTKLFECVIIGVEEDAEKDCPLTNVELIMADSEESAKTQAILRANKKYQLDKVDAESVRVLCRPFV